MGQSRPLFVYFRSFLIPITISIIQIEKSVDGVLGIRTRGRRMVGEDKTTELWRHPLHSFFKTKILVVGIEIVVSKHIEILCCTTWHKIIPKFLFIIFGTCLYPTAEKGIIKLLAGKCAIPNGGAWIAERCHTRHHLSVCQAPTARLDLYSPSIFQTKTHSLPRRYVRITSRSDG